MALNGETVGVTHAPNNTSFVAMMCRNDTTVRIVQLSMGGLLAVLSTMENSAQYRIPHLFFSLPLIQRKR